MTGGQFLVVVLWSEARALADLALHLRTSSASELPALPVDALNSLLRVLMASGAPAPDQQAGQTLLAHALTALFGQMGAHLQK